MSSPVKKINEVSEQNYDLSSKYPLISSQTPRKMNLSTTIATLCAVPFLSCCGKIYTRNYSVFCMNLSFTEILIDLNHSFPLIIFSIFIFMLLLIGKLIYNIDT